MRKIFLNSKKVIAILVLTAIMMCTVEPAVQAAVSSFQYNGFTMTKKGKRIGTDRMYSYTEVTATQTSNGAPGNAVAGASMFQNAYYTYIIAARKAIATSSKDSSSTTAWHSYGIGSERDAENRNNRWSQN